MSEKQQQEFFTPLQDAATRLGVPAAWLRTEAEMGNVPCLRAGRRLLFHVKTVEQLLLDRTQQEGVDDAQ